MSKIVEVTWKQGFPHGSADPTAVHNALEKIRKANNGELDPAIVVDTVSQTKRNVLRRFFEWDDSLAGQAHRITQARSLLRAVQVVYEDAPSIPTRAYVSVTVRAKDEPPKNVYGTIEDALNDPDARAELLKRALNDLVSFQRRFRGLQELAVVFRAVDQVLVTLEK